MVTTWNPFREMEQLRREIDRAFEGVGAGRWSMPFSRASFVPARAWRAYPLLNISEDAENVYVDALAPGLDPENLTVNVHNGVLTVSGEKKALNEDVKPESWHRNERGVGRFARSIELPSDVDPDKVSADYRNGLLSITLPRAEAAKPRQITVNVA